MKPGWRAFYLVQDELKRRTDDEVDAAEAALGLKLPPGYRELMAELGEGVISGILRHARPSYSRTRTTGTC